MVMVVVIPAVPEMCLRRDYPETANGRVDQSAGRRRMGDAATAATFSRSAAPPDREPVPMLPYRSPSTQRAAGSSAAMRSRSWATRWRHP